MSNAQDRKARAERVEQLIRVELEKFQAETERLTAEHFEAVRRILADAEVDALEAETTTEEPERVN